MSSNSVLSQRPPLKLSLALIVALVTVWTGCSSEQNVMAPRAGAPENQFNLTGFSTGAEQKPAPGSASIIVKSEVISATEGGTISAGNYSLTFSPGALDEDTEIEIRDVSSVRGHAWVELYPEGIVFKNPVVLESLIPAGTPPSQCRMWWWGQLGNSAWRWIDIGGTVSADELTISVVLQHFSTYAPGKAGWWKPQNPFQERQERRPESDRRQ